MADNNTIHHLLDLYDEEITKDAYGKTIRAKTMGQRIYINAMKRNDLVFGIGPAGTGKTFLAVVYAAKQLRKGSVKRIVLTRPVLKQVISRISTRRFKRKSRSIFKTSLRWVKYCFR